MYFTTFVVLSSALSAFSSPIVSRTVPQVESDISAIGTRVSSLLTNIKAFGANGGLANALAIQEAAGPLESAINLGTTDVKNTPTVSEADGAAILADVKAIQPTIISALTSIATQRAEFDAQPISGLSALVKSDLTTLNTDTTAFEEALINAAPADLKSSASAIKSAIDVAFSTALAAYNSA